MNPRSLLLLAGLIAAPASHAAVVTYDFTATVSSMFEYERDVEKITTVTSSTMTGRLIANGQTIRGKFSYDTQTPLSPYYQPEQPAGGSYQLYMGSPNNTIELIYDVDGYRFQSSRAPLSGLIQVKNVLSGTDYDIFSMNGSTGYQPVNFETASLMLFNQTGAAFTGPDIPGNLNFADFGYAHIDYGWLRQADGNQVHADATITSMSLTVADVPEPDVGFLIALGLGALAISRCQRDRESAPPRDAG